MQSAVGEMSGRVLSVRVMSLLLVIGLTSHIHNCTGTGATSISDSAEAFLVRYSTYHNSTGEISCSREWRLDLYSNGTVDYQYISLGPLYNSTKNLSSQLSMALVSEVYDTLVDDGFMMLDFAYEDAGWSSEDVNQTERLWVEAADETKRVMFSGHSIMGIVPNSYALLNNVMSLVQGRFPDIPDAALDIVVSEPPNGGPIADITAHFTNNELIELRDSGLCNISWPLFIVSANGSTVADLQGRIFPSCLMEFPPLTTRDFGPWSWDRSGLHPGEYVIMSQVVIWDCQIGEIASDLVWAPTDDQLNTGEGRESLSLALVGLCIVIAVAATFIILLAIKRGPFKRKGV